MKPVQVIFLIVLICASVAHSRNYERDEENLDFQQPSSVDVTHPHHQDNNRHMRHRKKRQYGPWNNYVHDYNQPWKPNYDTCPERELLSQMMKIMTLMLQKEKAATPNVYVSCSKDVQPSPPVNPSVDNRIPALEDPNMNWGLYKDDDKKPIDHDQFTRRPLNLEPYRPQNQESYNNKDFTTKSSPISVPRSIAEDQSLSVNPNICHFAYVVCCDKAHPATRHDCFTNLGCRNVPNGKSCDPQTQQEAFNFMVKSYKVDE